MSGKAYQNHHIDSKTARALAELGRAAARHAGIPDDVVITMTVCHDREHEWCDLCDPNFAQVTEDEFDEPRRVQNDQLSAQ
jgi:hypothetical protein